MTKLTGRTTLTVDVQVDCGVSTIQRQPLDIAEIRSLCCCGVVSVPSIAPTLPRARAIFNRFARSTLFLTRGCGVIKGREFLLAAGELNKVIVAVSVVVWVTTLAMTVRFLAGPYDVRVLEDQQISLLECLRTYTAAGVRKVVVVTQPSWSQSAQREVTDSTLFIKMLNVSSSLHWSFTNLLISKSRLVLTRLCKSLNTLR
jgi:hypothetical protein